ncbi:MAG: hypothetical protein OXN97_09900 [Bryobacterales bacterium]|nr:hypothetical protein [Bryobacterales bacterium]
MTAKPSEPIPGWDQLRHAGLLLDGQRLQSLDGYVPGALNKHVEQRLRRRAAALTGGSDDPGRTSAISHFVSFVLEEVCGFGRISGSWQRGSQVPPAQGRRAVTGETVKPRHLWSGSHGASLPVFIGEAKRIGIGRGRRIVSQVLGWLRAESEHLALVTNGRQWRLVFAGLDYDASCEWDTELWFEEGELADQVTAMRTLLGPKIWTPGKKGASSPILQAIRETRKGQADLSEVLGERVREAVEILVQSHGEALRKLAAGDDEVPEADIYRAACRITMRAVVILFAESRELLPRGNTVYDESYGLNGLFSQLERRDARGESMSEVFGAWPRVLALFRLVTDGSHHPDLPVHAYGGELFAAGRSDSKEGVSRALQVLETACFGGNVISDRSVYKMLHLLTRTRARIRQGRGGMWVTVPVDFSDLSSEYIGIVYEGLLDYELRTAPDGDPVVFLAVGDRPALPLSRLEAMDDKAIRELFKKLKKDASEGGGGEDDRSDDILAVEGKGPVTGPTTSEETIDERRTDRTRAEGWARRAAQVARLVRKPRGRMTPERRLAYNRKVGETARKLVHQLVLPGEWYLVRWGGTRKGSGSYYTRPSLAVPTVQRTLRPLAYEPPDGVPPKDARHAPATDWSPRLPEEILSLKACDPACGSGSFVLAALRFLTEALYESLQHHGRIESYGDHSLVWMLGIKAGENDDGDRLSDEQIPCAPDHPDFESILKARLRRHVVERCIYAVDLDPLAVELCRLSLWIETMDRDLPFGFLDHKIKCGNALVGAWLDQFQHYPAIAWKNREGGDKNHSNGVHFKKNARGEAIKAFHTDRLTPDMKEFLGGKTLFHEDLLQTAVTAHTEAIKVLNHMHELPIQDATERADVYRNDLRGSAEWKSLRNAMDLWCACWFWPADKIAYAPLPTRFADPPERTSEVAKEVAARYRFYHWELEFPDVFHKEGAGFDAMLGNPPWDIAKPASMEYFSNIDPLYRSYGKQEALGKQKEYFGDEAVERAWLDYCAGFRAQSNFVGRTRNPFGDPDKSDKSQNRFSVVRGKRNADFHQRWRAARRRSHGFADTQHPFRHQGSADLNLYKLFLETAHALAKTGGRIGFLVPSGLYSDNGTKALRMLFLRGCRWEWLFGIENRAKIFPIDSRAKFNPIIIKKGGSTQAIQTAFMRRDVEDWECAEELAIPYTRAQLEQFSPKSRAILEIQSGRDLKILEKIYANSVLLGENGCEGWEIQYAREFDMTNDSQLFPPRPKWEAKGYRPDEYSRWLKGDWHPIEDLWTELEVDPEKPVPAELELEDWLFDTSAGPERRDAEAKYVHGHLLKPGDVARTDWAVRCAQPPYDQLPVPRVAIPPGIILSRDGTEWIWFEEIRDVALPLYEGRMVGQFDFSEKEWVRGKGRGAIWKAIPWEWKEIRPQFLMGLHEYIEQSEFLWRPKVVHMNIGSATNTRTAIGSLVAGIPAGHSAPILRLIDVRHTLTLTALFNSFVFDFVTRRRVTGLHLDYHILEQNPLMSLRNTVIRSGIISEASRALCLSPRCLAPLVLESQRAGVNLDWGGLMTAITNAERIRIRAILDAIVFVMFGLDYYDLQRVLEGCDSPAAGMVVRSLNPKGFWRLDRQRDPELRQTILTLVAFRDLESKINAANGIRAKGIQDFFAQNEGKGWLLPESLCLSDYGLGRDERARQYQPVASRLGPRFYDWQLTQAGRELWHEWHLHARNLLGPVEHTCCLAPSAGSIRSTWPVEYAPITAEKHSKWSFRGRHTNKHQEPKREHISPRSAAVAQMELPILQQGNLFE